MLRNPSNVPPRAISVAITLLAVVVLNALIAHFTQPERRTMHFQQLPCRRPVAIQNPRADEVHGMKDIIQGYPVFQTTRQTFVLYPGAPALVCVCPFTPDTTLPVEGWYQTQLELYPVPGE